MLIFCWLSDLNWFAELSQEPEHQEGMGTMERKMKGARRETSSCMESYLESIDALPSVSMKSKSVKERCGEGLKSRNFPVPHGEKQIIKVLDSPTFSPFPDINFPDQLSFIPLHCFFITESSWENQATLASVD